MIPEFLAVSMRRMPSWFIGTVILAAIGGVFWMLPSVWGAGGLLAVGVVAWGWPAWRRTVRPAPEKPNELYLFQVGEGISGGMDGKTISQSRAPKVLMRRVDELLARYPRRPDIKLAKAQLLIQLYRDAHGARCYCREVIGATRRGDPLFQDAVRLHLSTYRQSGRTACAGQAWETYHPAVRAAHSRSPRPHRQIGAQIIPFPKRDALRF